MKRRFNHVHLSLVLLISLLSACESSEEKGTLVVEIWGEEFIEQGIPEEEFSDGWSLTFDKFLVCLGDVTVARQERSPDVVESQLRIYDLTRPGPTQVAGSEVPAGSYDSTSYRITPAAGAVEAGNASPADLDLMKSSGFSVYIEGQAEKTGEGIKTFTWGFITDTHYYACQSAAVVRDGSSSIVQLTVHGDHLFYDDLFSEEPNVSFDVPAQADSDGDNEISKAELQAFDISTLPNYQVGSTGIDNLWDFISYLTKTIGHIDGEGHCHTD